MSHTMKVRTDLNDQELLVAALVAIGFDRKQIEIHEQAQPVHNFYGRVDRQRANVIIRNQHAPGTLHREDLGWVREADGSYSIVLDDMTRDAHAYGPAWQKRLRREYMAARSCRALERQGLRPSIVRDGNRMEIRAAVAVRR